MSDFALRTDGLSHRYGDFLAVDRLDLRVPAASIYGFLGPNGAGKSTTLKCLTGLLTPSAGEIQILGLDPAAQPLEVRRRIGVMPENLALFDRLSAPETLEFVGEVHGMDREVRTHRAEQLLRLLGLESAGGAMASEFSHGMRKKLALAVSLLPGPRMLFLDEPFEGIDAVASRQIKNLLLDFSRRGGTLFLTSHILEVVERLCDHVGIIQNGRLLCQGALEQLREDAGPGSSLEQIFLKAVGGSEEMSPDLDWLGA